MVYTYDDIVNALKKAGLQRGDSVFVHSNLGYFGKLENCRSAEELSKAFYEAFIEVLGQEGTLIVPTFTYSFCHNEFFDLNKTPTKCGIFSEYIRNLSESVRSLDPNFSVTAIGNKAIFYTENPSRESFGINCFFERFLNAKGKIACLNFDCGSTFIHYAERLFDVPYRYNKAFNGMMTDGTNIIRDYAVHYVYDLEKPETAPDMTKLDKACKLYGVATSVYLGRGIINLMETEPYFILIEKSLKTDGNFLIKGTREEV